MRDKVVIEKEKSDLLAQPLRRTFSWLTWEKAAFIVLAIVALTMRLWDLGVRAMSHDESMHALYSWMLYMGQGYIHDPMMHGPFKFFANALVYFVFGASDFTARLLPAVFGSVLVILPYFLRKWIGRLGALVAALIIAFSPSFLFYSRYIRDDIYNMVWAVLMVIAIFRFLETRKNRYVAMFGIVGVIALSTMEASYITGFLFLLFLLFAFLWEKLSESAARVVRWAGLVVCAVGIPLAVWLTQGPATSAANGQGALPTGDPFQYFTLVVLLLTGAVLAAFAWRRGAEAGSVTAALKAIRLRTVLIVLGVDVAIFVLLYLSFFTNMRGIIQGPFTQSGLYTGLVQQILYWINQHPLARGGQPWYYIVILLGMYEFLPLLGALAAIVYYAFVRKASSHERDRLPLVPFLMFWAIGALAFHSWAGEKMPQHAMYALLPMVLLTGRLAQDWLGDLNWREAWKKGLALFAVLLPIGVYAVVRLFSVRPFQGFSLSNLGGTLNWLALLLVLVLAAWGLYQYSVRLGRRLTLQASLLAVFAVLFLLTVRFSWMASYVNGDTAKELLVYAHGTPDDTLTMDEIREISERTVGGLGIKVAYDDESAWPLEWYLREFPNRVFYSNDPTPDALDAPVVLVGLGNEGKVKPYLADNYYRFERRLVWWPFEDYKGLTPSRLLADLKDAAKRNEIWNILWDRKYPYNPDSWPNVNGFVMYVRKDVAQQMWQYTSAGATPSEPVPADTYLQNHFVTPAMLTIGQNGSGPGQFTTPRAVAVDSQGNIYVADSGFGDTGNHRVQVFDPSGAFLREWGEKGTGQGQFNEPWGIAVDSAGNVYVADTWNYRIQKFDSQGNFLTQWGTTGVSGDQPGEFYGPRGIAIAKDGTVLVVDTGNKRVQRFTPDGQVLASYGGFGTENGQFWEPVGIAVDKDGYIYVADTWNQRIQKFDSDFNFVSQWKIGTWDGQSIVNKPYLAVDSLGHVYASDPEGSRILEFTSDGQYLASFGDFGTGVDSFNLPTGLAIDQNDNLIVADSDNNRIMKFGPIGR